MQGSADMTMEYSMPATRIAPKLRDAALASIEALATLLEKGAHAAREYLHAKEVDLQSHYTQMHMPSKTQVVDTVACQVRALKEKLQHQVEARRHSPHHRKTEAVGGTVGSVMAEAVIGKNSLISAMGAGIGAEAAESAVDPVSKQVEIKM
jgi:hypothetical protein